MQIQINTDSHIKGHEAYTDRIRKDVESALSRISEHITRLEIHLTDVNGNKSGQEDKRCVMEARLEGRQPIAVTHQAATVDYAIDGATGKMIKMLEHTLDRLNDQLRGSNDPRPRS